MFVAPQSSDLVSIAAEEFQSRAFVRQEGTLAFVFPPAPRPCMLSPSAATTFRAPIPQPSSPIACVATHSPRQLPSPPWRSSTCCASQS